MNWLHVENALERLGGEAVLSDIEKQVRADLESSGEPMPEKLRESVSNVLQTNCAEYCYRNDIDRPKFSIFISVEGFGRGRWKLNMAEIKRRNYRTGILLDDFG